MGFEEDKNGPRWEAHAPSRFVYECPPDLKKLTFSYGVDREAYENRPQGDGTTGADVVISFERADGGVTQLFWRRLNPKAIGPDQGRQTSQVDIPPHKSGRLILQFLPGPMNDPAFDWTYWANLGGQGVGPDLRYGEKRIPAVTGEMFDGRPMEPLEQGRWSAQSPAKLVYPYVSGMSSLIFTYGLDEHAYDPARGTGSDGIEIVVEFEHPDLRLERLFDRLMDPRNNPGDRGPQTTRVKLPLENSGRIIVRVGPGPKSNTAFDWAYLGDLRAQGPGPDIVWGGRILVPVESETFNGLGMQQTDTDVWGAHAPSRLIYDRPPALEAVSFSYGLEPGSYANPDPGRRTDGVDVFVKFQDRSGAVTTLFHRQLTPGTNPNDRGRQSARVELPPDLPGRLLFIIGPGPRNSNAFDWAYWANFIGAP